MTSVSTAPIIFPQSAELPRQPVPPRFFVGMALIFVMVLATYGAMKTPLHAVVLGGDWINPLMTLGTALVCAGLFLLTMGSGEVSLKHLVGCLTVVLVLGIAVDVYEVSLQFALNGGRPLILQPISEYIPPPHPQSASSSQVLFIALNFVGFVVAEEIAKLAPVLFMIRMKWIRTTQAALCCGALSGMVFGLIESNCYGYIDFLGTGQPITEYLGRYFTMSTTHGLWDALGAGSAMWLGRRKARQGGSAPFAACVAGFLLTVAIHLCHNTLQAAIAPTIQLITILGILLPTYILIKSGWRHREPSPVELRPVPVVIALALVLGAGSALATSIPWTPLRAGQQVALLSETVTQLDHLLAGDDQDQLQKMTEEIEVHQPPLPRVQDCFAQIIQYLRDANSAEIARISLENGTISTAALRRSISARHPQRLLNDVRYELNRASNASELSTINPTTRRWQIEITSIESSIRLPADGKLCLIILSGQKLSDMLVPEEWSEPFDINLAAPWRTDVALQETQPILVLGHIDSQGSARFIDAITIAPRSFEGQLRLMRGSLAKVHIQFDAE